MTFPSLEEEKPTSILTTKVISNASQKQIQNLGGNYNNA
jgi:hypothetical protein